METKVVRGLGEEIEEEAKTAVATDIWVESSDKQKFKIPKEAAALSKMFFLQNIAGAGFNPEKLPGSREDNPYTLDVDSTTAQLFIRLLTDLARAEKSHDFTKQNILNKLTEHIIGTQKDSLTAKDLFETIISLYSLANRLDTPLVTNFIIKLLPDICIKDPTCLPYIADHKNIKGSIIPANEKEVNIIKEQLAVAYPELFLPRLGNTPAIETVIKQGEKGVVKPTRAADLQNPRYPIKLKQGNSAPIVMVTPTGELPAFTDTSITQIDRVSWSPDGNTLALGVVKGHREVRMLNLNPNYTLTANSTIDDSYYIQTMAWSPDSKFLVLGNDTAWGGSQDKTITLVQKLPDGTWGELKDVIITKEEDYSIYSLAFNPSGTQLNAEVLHRPTEGAMTRYFFSFSTINDLHLNQALLLPILEKLNSTAEGKATLQKNRGLLERAIGSYSPEDQQQLKERYFSGQQAETKAAAQPQQPGEEKKAEAAQQTAAASATDDLTLLYHHLFALSSD